MNDGDDDGVLPDGWAATVLGDIADCRLGKMLDQVKNRGEERPYLRNVNVQWGHIALDDVKDMRITADEVERYGVRPGDLLVCEGGEPGRCAVWRDAQEMYLQKALHRVRPRGGSSADYLRWWLQDAANAGRLDHLLTGSTIKHLPGRQLVRIEVSLPPVAEQQRIAARLDEIEIRRASTETHLDSALRIVEHCRRAVLAAACSGRLTKDWREDRGLSEWQTFSARDVCAKVQSGTTPKQWYQGTDGIPFLKVYNIVDQQLAFASRPQYIAPSLHRGMMRRAAALPGDVLMNIVGPPLGKVAIVTDDYPEWSINQALTLFRPSDLVTTEWLYVFLCSGTSVSEIIDKTRGTVGQINISLSQCREFQIPVPSLDEQAEVVRRASDLIATTDRLAARIDSIAGALDRASKAAVSKAFRGELVPTEAALADNECRSFESADELLARIESATTATPQRRGRVAS